MNIEQEYKDHIELYTTVATDCAEAEANYKDVDSQVKTKLAIAYANTDSIGSDGKRASANTREMQARFDPEFMEWENGVREANTKYIKLRARKDIGEKRIDMYRSLLSMEKVRAGIL